MKAINRKNAIKISAFAASALCAVALSAAVLPNAAASAEEAKAPSVSVRMAGAGVKIGGGKTDAIRFRAAVATEEYEKLKVNFEVNLGMLLIPKPYLSGELDLENKEKGVDIKQVTVLEEALYTEGTDTYYNVVLSGIPADCFTQDILARAYVTYTDKSASHTVYSEIQCRNLSYVAYKESIGGNAHTPEQETALQNYIGDKSFHEVSAAEGAGLTLDYDYAFYGQKLDLHWNLNGKWMKKVTVNGNDGNFDWATGKITMPDEAAAVGSVLRTQTDLPAVYATAENMKSFYVGKQWGNINEAETIADASGKKISDEDFLSLKNAGYKGLLANGNVAEVTYYAYGNVGNTQSVTAGVAFDTNNALDLFESAGYSDVSDRYYLSVWMKPDKALNIPVRFCLYDVVKKAQALGGEDTWLNIPANHWAELKIPLTSLASALPWMKDSNPEDIMLGLYSYHSALTEDTKVSFYTAELMLNETEAYENKSADLTYSGGNPLATWSAVENFTIFSGDTALEAGKDYTRHGNTVSGLKAGDYRVEYKIVSSRAFGGALNAYPESAKISRSLKIAKVYSSASIIDDMSDPSTVKAYTELTGSDTRKLENSTKTEASAGMITDEEYEMLRNAGYRGEKTQKTVTKLQFGEYSAPTNVYMQFDNTLTNEIFAAVLANNFSDVYVSVWLRSNQNFSFNKYSAIIGQSSKYVGILSTGEWKTAENIGDWVEIKLPIASLLDTSYYINNGYLQSGESFLYGFVLHNCKVDENYLSGATFEIFSMELVIEEKNAQANTETDVAISSAVFGEYTLEILDESGNSVSGGVSINGTKITIENAGTYTLSYKLTSPKFSEGTVLKTILKVS